MSKQALNLPEEEPQDLGFGSKVSRRIQLRLLNHDGTFNVRREGISALESLICTARSSPWLGPASI